MELLDASGMRETVDDMVLQQGRAGSRRLRRHADSRALQRGGQACRDWAGSTGGCGASTKTTLPQPPRLPHMGWNDVVPKSGARLFSGLEQDSRFYFLHSYYFDCASNDNVLATSEYGIAFGCAVRSNNIYGVQFHPEKSHDYGVRLLKNFAEL